jgi:hypothetical protein
MLPHNTLQNSLSASTTSSGDSSIPPPSTRRAIAAATSGDAEKANCAATEPEKPMRMVSSSSSA